MGKGILLLAVELVKIKVEDLIGDQADGGSDFLDLDRGAIAGGLLFFMMSVGLVFRGWGFHGWVC